MTSCSELVGGPEWECTYGNSSLAKPKGKEKEKALTVTVVRCYLIYSEFFFLKK